MLERLMMPDSIYWTLVENSPDLLEGPERFLAPAELEKLRTFRFPKRRSEWLLGRWTVKALLRGVADYARFAPQEIEIHSAPGGAPRVRIADGTAFPGRLSISHREDRALCALGLVPGLQLGADLERVEPRTDAFVADYFAEEEQVWALGQPPEKRDVATALVWSVKEAMLKALEVGLGWDTRWVEVLKVDGLADDGREGWKSMQVSSRAKEVHPWTAWWARRDEFVLTLAAFGGSGSYRLIKIGGEPVGLSGGPER